MTGASRLAEFQGFAQRSADVGYAGLVITESGRTAYLAAAAAALSGADLDLATGVAVAFPRSPMVTASTAWELAEASGGRFRLGLGTQVRAHIERRYGAAFDPPGPRLREYVQAVRAIFRAFRGEERLGFEGAYHRLSLLPPMWSPGPIPVPDPPIDVAAVNPWMLRMAGRHTDGVHVHPLNTVAYYEQTLLPNVVAGLRRAERGPESFALFVPLFTAVGDTDEERLAWWETSRTMVGFYGTTPNYAFVFEQLGFPGTTDALRAAQRAGDTAGMAAAVPDELLDHFCVSATWSELPQRIVDRCAALSGFDVQPVLYLAGMTATRGDGTFERFGAAAREVGRLTA